VQSDIEDVTGYTAASVGRSTELTATVYAEGENGASYCKSLHRKPIFSALYGTCTVTSHELKAVLKGDTLADRTKSPKTTGQQTTQEHGFQEARRRKRRATDETAGTCKKKAVQTKTSPP
jgi:hypothetical protein